MTGTESGSIVFVDKGKASISAMLNTEHGLKERIDFCFMRTINISYCVLSNVCCPTYDSEIYHK